MALVVIGFHAVPEKWWNFEVESFTGHNYSLESRILECAIKVRFRHTSLGILVFSHTFAVQVK